MEYNHVIIPYPYNLCLVMSSHLLLNSSYMSYYKGETQLSYLLLINYICSVLYWIDSNKNNPWRYLDIIFVFVTIMCLKFKLIMTNFDLSVFNFTLPIIAFIFTCNEINFWFKIKKKCIDYLVAVTIHMFVVHIGFYVTFLFSIRKY